jgi:hypothetical protein
MRTPHIRRLHPARRKDKSRSEFFIERLAAVGQARSTVTTHLQCMKTCRAAEAVAHLCDDLQTFHNIWDHFMLQATVLSLSIFPANDFAMLMAS